MKQPVNLILTLMALCIGGIIGLQLFWNYQNYQATVKSFQYEINQTLVQAVDQEAAQRRQALINQVKSWLADTTFIKITCDTKNQDSTTVFHITDRYSKFKGSTGFTFGIGGFKPKLTHVSPSVKQLVINHFADRRLRQDLQDGMIYFYTPRLGERLIRASDQSHVQLSQLTRIYRNRLVAEGVNTSFFYRLPARGGVATGPSLYRLPLKSPPTSGCGLGLTRRPTTLSRP